MANIRWTSISAARIFNQLRTLTNTNNTDSTDSTNNTGIASNTDSSGSSQVVNPYQRRQNTQHQFIPLPREQFTKVDEVFHEIQDLQAAAIFAAMPADSSRSVPRPSLREEKIQLANTSSHGYTFDALPHYPVEVMQSGVPGVNRFEPDCPDPGIPALWHEVLVHGHPITIISPQHQAAGSLPVPTAQQVMASLGRMPAELAKSIDRVVIHPQPRPARTPAHSITMAGVIKLYPGETPAQDDSAVLGAMIREASHCMGIDLDWLDDKYHEYKNETKTDPDLESDWRKARQSDPPHYAASAHARTHAGEDFAESVVLYLNGLGTPHEPHMRRLFPNRTRILDTIFSDLRQQIAAGAKPAAR